MVDASDDGLFTCLQAAAFYGTIELGEALSLPFDERLVSPSVATSRDYLVRRCLREVQKVGVSSLRWPEQWKLWRDMSEEQRNTGLVAVQIASAVDEQCLWHRKLTEILATLVCFGKTNSDAYYYHYIMLEELEGNLRAQSEQRDFFGSTSRSLAAVEKILVDRILEVETSGGLDLKLCWYLKQAAGVKPGTIKPGALISARARIKIALALAGLSEKAALGYCYEYAFSTPSQSIHFSVTNRERPADFKCYMYGSAQITFLVCAVLNRCQDLTGIHPEGVGSRVASDWTTRRKPVHALADVFQVGDFVCVHNGEDFYVAEVVGVATSDFGNDSYLVSYIDEKPYETIVQDWVTGPRILSLEMSLNSCTAGLASHADSNHDLKSALAAISQKELAMIHRKSVVTMWKTGIHSFVSRSVRGELKPGDSPLPSDLRLE